MELFLKASAAVLLAVVLILALKKQSSDIGVLLGIAVCCMVAGIAMGYLDPVMDFLEQLQSVGSLDGEMIGILMKAVGIGLLAEIAVLVCADAGNASLGKTLQLLANAVILWLSLPLFRGIFELVQKILGEV